MGRTQGHRRNIGAGRRLTIQAVTAAALIITAGCGLLGDDDATPDDDTIEAVTVALEAVGTTGDDPFFDSVAISETTLTDDITTAAIDGILTATTDTTGDDDQTAPVVAGETPGLYGGTRDQTSCDVTRLTEFLTDPANTEKATAFATALGMTVEDIPQVLAGYTPVTLTLDTLVTNHGYTNGRATPFPAVLQAGTAVLIDATGTPRVKCSCGNPLTPPTDDIHLTTTTVTGTPWQGWTPDTTANIRPAPTPQTDLTLTDTTTGDTYQQPTGNTGSQPVDGAGIELDELEMTVRQEDGSEATVAYGSAGLVDAVISVLGPPDTQVTEIDALCGDMRTNSTWGGLSVSSPESGGNLVWYSSDLGAQPVTAKGVAVGDPLAAAEALPGAVPITGAEGQSVLVDEDGDGVGVVFVTDGSGGPITRLNAPGFDALDFC